ncbi:DUF6232 family protein [Streptomyces sp. ICC1]|uniref:DUF6232 family protein n=1 Tax=Streptomyces sp. ICC1 TaxID=2099583 RepID=UPI000DC7A3B1|nr:DUF6232 family protein [Streptomyces sp. ICC1]AWZ09213.1 hypothetical protein DRB89_37260 [Streptomyces sp. ICC4]AWZ16937.1 hypothetical protein DRB96_37595 [Streptomyces sp. ICC1]
MADGTTTVQVRVQEGVLWVDGEAYPLHNISHVGQRVLEVNKGAAWKQFIRRALLCLVVGGIAAAIFGNIAGILAVVVFGLLVWQLVQVISRPPVYGLILNTSGTQRDAVWSLDRAEIENLVQEITKAIGRPDAAPVTINIKKAVMGDQFKVYGAGAIGQAQHSGSGDIRGGGR